jgi:exopolysaccharide biosynthesis protein
LLSENIGQFTSGGFLLVDQKGNASIQRIAEWHAQQDYSAYRMIVQSNIILVHNGQEDQNSNFDRAARTALSIQKNGQLSVVVVHEKNKSKNGYGLTQKEFGDLLVALGSKEAINLDGGPSVQFAVRDPNCSADSSQCVEQWVPSPDDMPQLFTVSK